MSPNPVFGGVAQSLVFCVVFRGNIFVLFYFYFLMTTFYTLKCISLVLRLCDIK